MACRVITLNSVRSGLERIVRYVSEDLASPQAAQRLLDAYEQGLVTIAQFPLSHALCADPDLAKRGYRSFSVGRYIVLYRHADDAVVVSHIFHQSQDYARYVLPRQVDV